ncbi:hypothetical protein DENSPDRAFT_789068 [Dentipellis sp. KUC8613]|nr:hypothetical protein DENSPDRAFT_789068 [Dentipellis sp. KUC8613]
MDVCTVFSLKYNSQNIPIAIVMYDIMCQYGVNFVTRVQEYQFLDLPFKVEVRKGIGLFHVHGHEEKCFAQFAPSFVRGMGQVDGEIVETLWAPLTSDKSYMA